jgi:ribosomal protein S12 methylthiotransferase accessory factor
MSATINPFVEAALLSVAERLDAVFELPSRAAPGLRVFGAQLSVIFEGDAAAPRSVLNLSGAGLSAVRAFQSCMGEAVEVLSQIERPGDVLRSALSDPVDPLLLAQLERQSPEPLDALEALNLVTGQAVLVPADLCLRRSPAREHSKPFRPLSEGCAAGQTPDHALLAALLERIERDAAALWWIGGRRGRGFSDDDLIACGAKGTIDQLRGACTARRTWLLDITTDLMIPCVAAISCDENDRRLSCGLAARMGMTEAIDSALFELCAQEINHHLAEEKQAGNPVDDLDLTVFDILRPMGRSPIGTTSQALSPVDAIAKLALILAGAAIEPLVVDLTRTDIAIPAVMALTPGLQPMTPLVWTARLAEAAAAFGGGDLHRAGVKLL